MPIAPPPSTTTGPSKAAVIVAVMLMVVGGVVYRSVAQYLDRPIDAIPMPPGTLAQLPLRLGDWQGRDVPLAEAVIRATDTDDHVHRNYRRVGGAEALGLFVAYGVRARDLMPHRPEVCYPGAGWTLRDAKTIEVTLPDGSDLPCRLTRFAGGGLDGTMVAVLNYYIVDGHYSPTESLLRARAMRGGGSIRYMAQVQITRTLRANDSDERIETVLREFTATTAGPIRALLPDTSASPNQPRSPQPTASRSQDS